MSKSDGRVPFFENLDKFADGTQTATRRVKWEYGKEGSILSAFSCDRRTGKVYEMGRFRVVSIRRQRLGDATAEQVRQEGYPHGDVALYIRQFCRRGGDDMGPETITSFVTFERINP